jgi:hypothetical protein
MKKHVFLRYVFIDVALNSIIEEDEHEKKTIHINKNRFNSSIHAHGNIYCDDSNDISRFGLQPAEYFECKLGK